MVDDPDPTIGTVNLEPFAMRQPVRLIDRPHAWEGCLIAGAQPRHDRPRQDVHRPSPRDSTHPSVRGRNIVTAEHAASGAARNGTFVVPRMPRPRTRTARRAELGRSLADTRRRVDEQESGQPHLPGVGRARRGVPQPAAGRRPSSLTDLTRNSRPHHGCRHRSSRFDGRRPSRGPIIGAPRLPASVEPRRPGGRPLQRGPARHPEPGSLTAPYPTPCEDEVVRGHSPGVDTEDRVVGGDFGKGIERCVRVHREVRPCTGG